MTRPNMGRASFRFFLLTVCAGFLLQAVGVTLAAPRPNIIIIMADDLGYSDIGCFGGEIETPHLDRLAREGLRFTQFYNESKCTESRASLMTGSTHHVSRNLKNRGVPTLPELLRQTGYRTLMSGKWHLADTPVERGFDRYFGFLNGAVSFWTGEPSGQDKTPQWRLDDQPWAVPSDGFYATDAITEKAIEFIGESGTQSKPFFLYLAYNAPHYPLHAWPKDIAKYRGQYSMGWDALRRQRHDRMVQMGLIPKTSKLSERDPNVPAWESISETQQKEYALLMAVYAAMVDRMDQNIGQLHSKLQEWGLDRNTLILFCSDNGGCPYQNEEKPDSIPGGPESHRTYNTPWANASNTPFRLYKRHSHEGGISSPAILHWPDGLSHRGITSDQIAHLIDLLPTCLDLAGAKIPEQIAGESLVPAFQGGVFQRKRPLHWEYRNHRAIRDGEYKLVAEAGSDWSLFHIPSDRIEGHDLAASKPDLVQQLSKRYDEWAIRVGGPDHKAGRSAAPMKMKDYRQALGARP